MTEEMKCAAIKLRGCAYRLALVLGYREGGTPDAEPCSPEIIDTAIRSFDAARVQFYRARGADAHAQFLETVAQYPCT